MGFKYEPNGSFGNENEAKTKKLGPKQKSEKRAKQPPKSLGYIASDYGIMAKS